jgi:hypothetical protein
MNRNTKKRMAKLLAAPAVALATLAAIPAAEAQEYTYGDGYGRGYDGVAYSPYDYDRDGYLSRYERAVMRRDQAMARWRNRHRHHHPPPPVYREHRPATYWRVPVLHWEWRVGW